MKKSKVKELVQKAGKLEQANGRLKCAIVRLASLRRTDKLRIVMLENERDLLAELAANARAWLQASSEAAMAAAEVARGKAAASRVMRMPLPAQEGWDEEEPVNGQQKRLGRK